MHEPILAQSLDEQRQLNEMEKALAATQANRVGPGTAVGVDTVALKKIWPRTATLP
jgi:hypothetical protein